MIFELNDKTYRVRFTHVNSMTFAELFVVDENGVLTATSIEGVSICSPKDTFVKKTGRKVALADLLDKMEAIFSTIGGYQITKEDRREIWAEYFDRFTK